MNGDSASIFIIIIIRMRSNEKSKAQNETKQRKKKCRCSNGLIKEFIGFVQIDSRGEQSIRSIWHFKGKRTDWFPSQRMFYFLILIVGRVRYFLSFRSYRKKERLTSVKSRASNFKLLKFPFLSFNIVSFMPIDN